MPTIKKLLPNGDLAVIKEDGSVIKIAPDGSIRGNKNKFDLGGIAEKASSAVQNPLNIVPFGEVARQTGKLATSPVGQELGKGFAEGATLGAIPAGNGPEIISPQMSLGRKSGRFMGSLIPVMAAEATGGAAAGIGGLGTLGRTAASGLTLGAMEGAVSGKGLAPAIEKTAERAGEFSALGAIGNGLGYLRNVFGEKAAGGLANLFLKTPRSIAEKLSNKGEESLGLQALKFKGRFGDNPLTGFKNQKEVLSKAKEELFLLRNESGGIIQEMEKEAAKPKLKPVMDRPLLGYEPTGKKLETVRPPVINVPPEYNPEEITGVSLPRTSRIGERFTEPKVGTIPGIEDFGERTIGGKSAYSGKFLKNKGIGAFEKLQEINSLRRLPDDVKDSYRQQFRLNEQSKNKIVDEIQNVSDLKDSALRNWQKDYPYTIEERGPFINIKDLASDLNDDISKFERVGKKTGPSSILKKIQKDFIESNPEQISTGDAITVKSTLDKIVNEAYGKEFKDNSTRDQVYRTLANGLRKRLYSISPKLGENFDKQSLMHDIISSLKPTQAVTGNLSFGGIVRTLASPLTQSPVGLGTATALNRTMGQKSKFIAPALNKVSRAALLQDENN